MDMGNWESYCLKISRGYGRMERSGMRGCGRAPRLKDFYHVCSITETGLPEESLLAGGHEKYGKHRRSMPTTLRYIDGSEDIMTLLFVQHADNRRLDTTWKCFIFITSSAPGYCVSGERDCLRFVGVNPPKNQDASSRGLC